MVQCKYYNIIFQINKKILTKEKIIERVRQEVSIHSKLDHPSILKLYTFFEDDHFVYLVLELCQNVNLLQQVPFHEKQGKNMLNNHYFLSGATTICIKNELMTKYYLA